MMTVIQYLVAGSLVFRMVQAGYFPPVGRVLSWPMYSYGEICIAELNVVSESGDRQTLSPYDVRVPGEFALAPDEIDDMIEFLVSKGYTVRADGYAYGDYGERQFEVQRSCGS